MNPFSKKYPYLLWVDLETTGTKEDSDDIIEFGCILTTSTYPYKEIFRENWVVKPSPNWKSKMNDFVTEMHLSNGLIEEVDKNISLFPLENLGARIVTKVLEHGGEKGKVVIAGSGVSHFDRRFIKTKLPDLDKFLAYPAFDVGVIRRWLQSLSIISEDKELSLPHRAIQDAERALEEARSYAFYVDAD